MRNATKHGSANLRFAMSAAVLLAPVLAMAEVPIYQIKDLGTLGGDHSQGVDINDIGEVTGSATTADGATHAFIYADGKMRDLGTLGGRSSEGASINDTGQVTGSSETTDGYTHAFRYANGLMTDLGTVSGTFSVGTAINAGGTIAGLSTTPAGDYHAIFYDAQQGMQDLGTLGDTYSRGDGINDAGEVTGIYQNQFESHAFLYQQGVMLDLVPGVSSYVDPLGRSINAFGHVAGSYSANGSQQAFVYQDGAAVDLGTLGGERSGAVAINSHDQATGSASTENGEAHAFLYSAGTMIDLGTLGGTYSMGYALNDDGIVVGTSTTTDGYSHPFAYRNGQMIDVRPPGSVEVQDFQIDVASAINSAGQIAGWYNIPGDEPNSVITRAFIATPISLLLTQLLDKSVRVPYGIFLGTTVHRVQRAYDAANLQATCVRVASFAYQIKLYRRVKVIDPATATALTADSTAIADALGCPDSGKQATTVTKVTANKSTTAAAQVQPIAATAPATCAATNVSFCRATPPLSRLAAAGQR